MKLDKNTRNCVKVGSVLSKDGFEAKVMSVMPSGKYVNGLSITLLLLTGNLKGKMLYARPLSEYYGFEIDNTDAEPDRLETLAGRLDQVIKTIEPYDYEGSADEALERLRDNPIGIIEYLVGMLEEMEA